MTKTELINKWGMVGGRVQFDHTKDFEKDLDEFLSDRASEVGVQPEVMPKIAEVKRNKTLGVWESIRERFVCPKCETEEILDSHSYCPNCGIKINFVD